MIVTFLLAAFLGFGKRLHELVQSEGLHFQRKVLRGYSDRVLYALLRITAVCTVGVYTIYTVDPSTAHFFGTRHLVWSTPFAIFGVFRFLYLVRHRPEAESPTEEMLRDWPFMANLGLWGIATLVIIYA